MSNYKIGMVVFDKNSYFYPWSDQCVQAVRDNLITRIIKKICKEIDCSLPSIVVNSQIFQYDYLIFTDSAMSVGLGNYILKKFDQDRICLYYMNSISRDNEIYMKYFSNIFSFDYEDAKKYNLRFLHTPYNMIPVNEDVFSEKIECIYLGKNKGREGEIIKVYEFLKSKGLVTKFMVLDTQIPDIKLDEPINYLDYLKILKKSDCIIEIVAESQSGCTLRYLESLFYKHKIITNNKRICYDKFYNKENVYIIDSDERDIVEFVRSPFKNNKMNLNQLKLDVWLKNIIENLGEDNYEFHKEI